jgi:acetyl-CoA/propionyl-CoA carboxylase biotin carboxyl carrier protein
VGSYKEPSGPGVRVDSGLEAGGEVTPMYDPMVAKLIVWDVDREQATQRMLRALREYQIEGLKTLIPFHSRLLATEEWARAETARNLLEDKSWLKELAFEKAPPPAEEGEEEKVEQTYTVEVSGKRFDVKVIGAPPPAAAANGATPAAAGARKPPRRERSSSGGGATGDTLPSPLQGNVWKVLVEQGQKVEEGQLVTIIEAMKMENEITAHKAGVIAELLIKEGEPITAGAPLAVIKDEG